MPTQSPLYVIDANVLISAIVFKSDYPARAIQKALSLGDLVISQPVMQEYVETLGRAKFDPYLSLSIREDVLNKLILAATSVRVTSVVPDCRDPKDNKYLELAIDAGATAIISGDKDLLELHPFKNIPVLTPYNFVHAP